MRHSVLPACKMASYSCRLCEAPVFSKHAVAIFSLTATKQGQLSSRIKDMLDVEVGLDHGLPQHIGALWNVPQKLVHPLAYLQILKNPTLLLRDKQPEDICTLHRVSTQNLWKVLYVHTMCKELHVKCQNCDKGSSQEMSEGQNSVCSPSVVQISSQSSLPLLTATEPLPLQ